MGCNRAEKYGRQVQNIKHRGSSTTDLTSLQDAKTAMPEVRTPEQVSNFL